MIAVYCIFMLGTIAVITGSKEYLPINCDPHAKYRTYDGSCNNLDHPTWGQAGTLQNRFRDKCGSPMVDYDDGKGTPRGGINKSTLPSARLISNKLSDITKSQGNQKDKRRTGQLMAFGQLIAHDCLKTVIPSDIKCCDKNESRRNDPDICFPLKIPKRDNHFAAGCKNFVRATAATKDKDLPDYREQINAITSVWDASFCYGSSKKELEKLREADSYLMKTDQYGLLPAQPPGEGGCVKRPAVRCPMAGDTRVPVIANLDLNHLVWVQEHNRIAKELHRLNKHWDTETVFEQTRKLIIAVLQHIIYNHYLPAILDKGTMTQYDLFSTKSGYDDPYCKFMNPSICNGFGTGPFRYGHAQIMQDQSLLSDDYITLNATAIEKEYFDPEFILGKHGINVEKYARWITYISAKKINNFAVDGIRDKLFQPINEHGDDLFSRNIQRGRDHGNPAFNKWRKFCGLKPKKFRDFGKYGRILRRLYGSVDKIDFFVGGLLEQGFQGGVGPTFACIIAKQFVRLKSGDRFWYERPDKNFKFTKAQLNSIKRGSSLSKMFCRHFHLNKIQRDIFRHPNDKSALVDCNNLPDINLYLWKERRRGRNSTSTNQQ